ncbi:hypothetical protein DICPUDRAFT_149685 [Dictyostelium purpureum]|uniref:SAM domain-containing protein n=1 Tax=Dictyostelium purpureum TaxID=5786 RepID=F0ZEE4_DICPU|nr:uncharacterized protein DICPUDRAFT_149685 [Dictyostelium purpureum]EGC37678.1 hypothetical protein DICPUDRAFT_149685 [Dictyostelium purpureum]|eukprot:XP_003285782.1 hypothetical protein DICPUDRAFT_149685 [Dictyostelium purpureum]
MDISVEQILRYMIFFFKFIWDKVISTLFHKKREYKKVFKLEHDAQRHSNQNSNGNNEQNLIKKPVSEWESDEVCKWLKKNNVLKALIPIFRNINIDGSILLQIDGKKEQLENYGINTFGLKKNFKYEMNRALGKKNPITEKLKYEEILNLTIGQVSNLLGLCNLSTLKEIIEKNHVNGIALLHYEDKDFEDLKIPVAQKYILYPLIGSYYKKTTIKNKLLFNYIKIKSKFSWEEDIMNDS